MIAAPLAPLLLRGDCLVELARIPDESVDAVVTDPPYGLEFMGKQWDSFSTGRGEKYAAGGSLEVNAAESTKGGEPYKGRPSYVNRPAKRCGICGRQQWSGSPCKCDAPRWVMDNSPLESFERFTEAWSRECFRILKPGGHMLAFGGSRTWHRLAAGIEDAGFELRDSIAWLYGSGFPKSMDVSKAIDKAAGVEREVVGEKMRPDGKSVMSARNPERWTNAEGWDRPWRSDPERIAATGQITAPATDAAREWEGWGTALKPAFEPIVVARKPLIGTVAANVLRHGTGALNIDAARIGSERRVNAAAGNKPGGASLNMSEVGMPQDAEGREAIGRWPANVILDESQAAALDAQSGNRPTSKGVFRKGSSGADRDGNTSASLGAESRAAGEIAGVGYGDSGGASRFFYVAKAPKSERPVVDGTAHPTVKPLAIMRYLLRLVTPPGGVVVDPFAGSGTTLEAAYLEGFESIGVEMTPDYWPLIEARIERVTR